jgi:hypothetical protein
MKLCTFWFKILLLRRVQTNITYVTTVLHCGVHVITIHSGIAALKVHKNENFFGFDFEFCTISMLVMHK